MDKLLKILRRKGMMEVAQLALLLDQSEADVYKRQAGRAHTEEERDERGDIDRWRWVYRCAGRGAGGHL